VGQGYAVQLVQGLAVAAQAVQRARQVDAHELLIERRQAPLQGQAVTRQKRAVIAADRVALELVVDSAGKEQARPAALPLRAGQRRDHRDPDEHEKDTKHDGTTAGTLHHATEIAAWQSPYVQGMSRT